MTEENGPACLVSRRSSPGSFPRLFFTPVHFSSPGGLVPRAGKKGECWTFLDWRLNSENDSPVHGQPSFDSLPPLRSRSVLSCLVLRLVTPSLTPPSRRTPVSRSLATFVPSFRSSDGRRPPADDGRMGKEREGT